MSIFMAVVYGIIHDQVTVRICIEYFTIGHAPVFNTMNPTLLALGWGVIATWWMGLILGVMLSLSARIGRWPKRHALTLVRPLAVVMIVTGGCALVAGIIGWLCASNGIVALHGPLASRVPAEKHIAFLADAFAHLASYGMGSLFVIALAIQIVMSRASAARTASHIRKTAC